MCKETINCGFQSQMVSKAKSDEFFRIQQSQSLPLLCEGELVVKTGTIQKEYFRLLVCGISFQQACSTPERTDPPLIQVFYCGHKSLKIQELIRSDSL